mgnify:CR=1 FL=1
MVSEPEVGIPSSQGTDAASPSRPKLRYALLRPALDACVAFMLFVLVSLALTSGPSSASPHRLMNPGLASPSMSNPAVATPDDRQIFDVAARPTPATADAVYRQTDTAAAWLLLSLAFSLIRTTKSGAATNLNRISVVYNSEVS